MKNGKSRIALLLAALLLLLAAPAGCGMQQKEVDLRALCDTVLHEVAFRDELCEVDASIFCGLYEITDAEEAICYAGSGATAEELAAFAFADGKTAAAAVEQAQARLERQKRSFADYLPAEVRKLDAAVVKQSGRYLIVCVCDGGNAGQVISDFLKGA